MDFKDTRKTLPALVLIILLVGIVVGIVLVKRQQSASSGAAGLPSASYLQEDFNHDGVVDEQDLFLFKELFAAKDPKADLDGSGQVTSLDYNLFLSKMK